MYKFYNLFSVKIQKLISVLTFSFIFKTKSLTSYYLITELIWQEGLLVDFLQKKIVDSWIKKFLVQASYLFNERLVFDNIIKFFLNLIIWPFQKNFIFEFNNVLNLFLVTILLFVFFTYFLLLTFFIFF